MASIIASSAGVGVFGAPIATGASAMRSAPTYRAALRSERSTMIRFSDSAMVISSLISQPDVLFGVTGRMTSTNSSVSRPVVSRIRVPSKGPGFEMMFVWPMISPDCRRLALFFCLSLLRRALKRFVEFFQRFPQSFHQVCQHMLQFRYGCHLENLCSSHWHHCQWISVKAHLVCCRPPT